MPASLHTPARTPPHGPARPSQGGVLHAEDIAIVGAGCAGLSLALALAAAEPGLPIVLLEPRRADSYTNDRTWCWWDVEPTGFEWLADGLWARWKTRHHGREALQVSSEHAYHRLPAERFYTFALDRLDALPNVELRLGETVRAVHDHGTAARIETDREAFTVTHAFDSRPCQHRAPRLWQHFLGIEVETPVDTFDPRTVTLMDFDLPLDRLADREPRLADAVAGFAYVLPDTPRNALVELTFLSPQPFAESTYREAIARYLAVRHGVDAYRERRVERGRIPMDSAIASDAVPAGPDRAVTRIGTAGGAVRASSGYAFAGVQRWSHRLVRARRDAREGRVGQDGRTVSGSPWSLGARLMDRLFLDTLQRCPERAPGCFHALFERAATEPLLRFLCDDASTLDRLRVSCALPKRPFVSTALAGIGVGLRTPRVAERVPE